MLDSGVFLLLSNKVTKIFYNAFNPSPLQISRLVDSSNPEKRKVIKQFIRDQRVDLVCLQETKVQNMNLRMARA